MQTIRLTEKEIKVIKSTAREVMGENAKVWLFGSRVDDKKRGGDIDLLVESDIKEPLRRIRSKSRFWAKLQQRLGDQKIDIILAATKPDKRTPIETIARKTGVRL